MNSGSSPRSWGTHYQECGSVHACQVHPHARGELLSGVIGTIVTTGSSPRSWGTPVAHEQSPAGDRFIPTLVGNSRLGGTLGGTQAVHPHARGELATGWVTAGLFIGSSPRSWGTLWFHGDTCNIDRFIPTLVGNSQPGAVQIDVDAVHPHARGELGSKDVPSVRDFGSSPRSWGTPNRSRRCDTNRRFIPTLVGNSGSSSPRYNNIAVHPHARGELRTARSDRGIPHGSSPRSWGTRPVGGVVARRCRFIPTLVGNSTSTTRNFQRSSVHPHARGELAIIAGAGVGLYGSSPRSWGTHEDLSPAIDLIRFIPTLVGNSLSCDSISRRILVHPHARGELVPWRYVIGNSIGSSPRSWGTPPHPSW